MTHLLPPGGIRLRDWLVWAACRQQLIHRGKGRLLGYLRRRYPDLRTSARVRRGIGLGLDARDPLQSTLLFTGSYEPETVWFMERFLRGIRSAVDVGCNIGFFGCYLQSLAGGRLCLTAIDANPWACERARQNLARNGFAGRVLHHAVGDHTGTATLSVPHTDWGRASLAAEGLLGPERGVVVPPGRHPATQNPAAPSRIRGGDGFRVEAIEVPMQPLDRLLEAHCVPPPDFVKIDVEGAEPLVFRGAEPSFWTRIPFLLFEHHSSRLRPMGLGLRDLWRDLPLEGARLGFLRPGRHGIAWVRSPADIPDGTNAVVARG